MWSVCCLIVSILWGSALISLCQSVILGGELARAKVLSWKAWGCFISLLQFPWSLKTPIHLDFQLPGRASRILFLWLFLLITVHVWFLTPTNLHYVYNCNSLCIHRPLILRYLQILTTQMPFGSCSLLAFRFYRQGSQFQRQSSKLCLTHHQTYLCERRFFWRCLCQKAEQDSMDTGAKRFEHVLDIGNIICS